MAQQTQERILAIQQELALQQEKFQRQLEEQQAEIARLREENAEMSARAQRAQEESLNSLRERLSSGSAALRLPSFPSSRANNGGAAAQDDRLPLATRLASESENNASEVALHAESAEASQSAQAQPQSILNNFEQRRRSPVTVPSPQGGESTPKPGWSCTIL